MIRLIACVSKNMGLGYKDKLLFEIKDDLRRFQQLTRNNICLMGRSTFDSIVSMNGKPLSDRVSVILTRNKKYKQQFNEFVFHDIDSILKGIKTMGENDKDVWVIGGNQIYALLLPFVDEIFLTIVDQHIDEVDTFYPMELQESLGFIPIDSEERYDETSNLSYRFVRYAKEGSE